MLFTDDACGVCECIGIEDIIITLEEECAKFGQTQELSNFSQDIASDNNSDIDAGNNEVYYDLKEIDYDAGNNTDNEVYYDLEEVDSDDSDYEFQGADPVACATVILDEEDYDEILLASDSETTKECTCHLSKNHEMCQSCTQIWNELHEHEFSL